MFEITIEMNGNRSAGMIERSILETTSRNNRTLGTVTFAKDDKKLVTGEAC